MTMTNKQVTFDAAKTRRLRDAYELASRRGNETFRFEENEYVVAYAFCLLQYLEPKFNRHDH